MKILLLTILLISTTNLFAQDVVKTKLAELWWNNEIEITNNRNKKLNRNDAINLIRNQKVSTNCWSNFYRYTQNIQQSSGEQVSYFSFDHAKIIQTDSNKFKVVSTIDEDTGEEMSKTIFSYKLIKSKIKKKEHNEQINKFLNQELRISNVLFKDTLNQIIDGCHIKYSIELRKDGTFKQGYKDQTTCNCKITSKEFEQIHHIGFAKFDEANHSLLGLNGEWKIEDQNLYLKFPSGNIFKYRFQIEKEKLKLGDNWTTIELKIPTDNNR